MTRRVLGSAAAAVDRAAAAAVQARNARRMSVPPIATDRNRAKVLEQMTLLYPSTLGDDFFLPVTKIAPTERPAPSSLGYDEAVDLSWASLYEPYIEGMRERYLRTVENQAASVRFFRARAPRPVAILIHGYLAGSFNFEQRVWPLARLLHGGFDVALFTLPFHALRADPEHEGRPQFPSNDPRFSNEGFRQVVGDLRNFVHWLKARGHPQVGLMGMSLGGYTAALTATVEPSLAFLVPIIPLASLPDFALEHGELNADPEVAAREHALLEAVYRVVSPLYRAPRIAPARTLVVGAKADRITPVAHARRLASHFGAPLISWHGGHLLQFGRAACFERVEAFLHELGFRGS
ncbi:MAG TPA: alpha/beta hydrolase family protein [Polyangiaceae bacterium]